MFHERTYNIAATSAPHIPHIRSRILVVNYNLFGRLSQSAFPIGRTSHLDFQVAYKPFPKHWGVPPNAQMKGHDGIMRDLPGGYGKGNAPMAKWVAMHMEKDAKSSTTERGMKPYPYGNYSL